MTNLEIITRAAVIAGIDPATNINTYIGWKRAGYQVKKGERAVFKTRIWKPCKVKQKQTDSTDQEKKLILVNASFFTDKQVEEIL